MKKLITICSFCEEELTRVFLQNEYGTIVICMNCNQMLPIDL